MAPSVVMNSTQNAEKELGVSPLRVDETVRMDVIEFLQRTDQRNLKYNIDFLVKCKMREREAELNERRQRLKRLLDTESEQHERELSQLLRSRLDAKEGERLDWIGLMRLERERAEAELLELKNTQRHLENAEEVRHIYSREMLMESKQSQLHQIEEKRAMRERQAEVERFWLKEMQKYNQGIKNQEILEQNLRKAIADAEQQGNMERDAEMRAKGREEAAALREELNVENERASSLERKYKKDNDFYEWRKKIHHRDVLERQMQKNAITEAVRRQEELAEDNLERQKIQREILSELDREGADAVKNRVLQKHYLEHAQQEKEALLGQERNFEVMLIGTGCVLEQKNKKPYGKSTR